MIDKLHITIKLIELPPFYHYFLWNKITPEKYKSWGYNPKRWIKGKYQDMEISLNPMGLLVCFNPTKFLLGDNLGLITIMQFEDLLKTLSDELEVNLFAAKVLRLDLGGNIVMKYPVAEYEALLFSSRYLKRENLGSTLYFKNKDSRTVSIYDKIAELEHNKVKRDSFLSNKNILRYEIRYLKPQPLAAFLKIKTVRVDDVILSWSKMVDEWVNVFLGIKKVKEQLMFKEDAFAIKGEVDRQLKIIAINSLGGLHHAHKLVDTAKARGYFKKYPAQGSHLKAKFSGWMNHPAMFEVSQKAVEVEMKVKRLGENCKRDVYEFL